MGSWGEAELFLGIWGAKANTFRETRTLFSGRQGDQCIIFKDQGSKDVPYIIQGRVLHVVGPDLGVKILLEENTSYRPFVS